MKTNTPKLIVVLGMHRSGTSAITRGLQVFGVNLGDELLPAQEDNTTGFWEDADLNALNIEMLHSLNMDWHFLAPLQRSDLEELSKAGYFSRAADLIRQKTSDASVFGFKDPRVAKLLPFWKEVFAQSHLKASYIIAIRHPLSVCKSLENRHGFDPAKSAFLWLEHVVNSLAGTQQEQRILVDYDNLLQSPNTTLAGMAEALGLQINANELEKFKNEFLSQGLRHTIYTMEDLMRADSMPPLAAEIYLTLARSSKQDPQLKSALLKKKAAQWKNEHARITAALIFIDKLSTQIQALTMDCARQETLMKETLAEKDAQIQLLTSQLNEIKGSKAWRAVTLFRRIRKRLPSFNT